MADSSLDDFFAKKDKSKKKTKSSKYTSDDFLAKQKIKKKTAKNEETKQQQQTEISSEKTPGDNDEEWLDVQEEEKDYTGLRIQKLQIQQEKENEEKEKEARGSGDEDDESENKQDTISGPWAKKDGVPVPNPIIESMPEPEPEIKKEEPPARTGKYIPPGARQTGQTGSSQSIGPGMGAGSGYRRGKKEAPNLQSEEDFPTLGGDAPIVGDSVWGSGSKFEKVRSGGKQLDNSANKGPQLSLGNKYTALQSGGTE